MRPFTRSEAWEIRRIRNALSQMIKWARRVHDETIDGESSREEYTLGVEAACQVLTEIDTILAETGTGDSDG